MSDDEATSHAAERASVQREVGELSVEKCRRLAEAYRPDVDYWPVLRALLRRLERQTCPEHGVKRLTGSSPAAEQPQTRPEREAVRSH